MNVLAVGAHWDDIEIGCGASLIRLRQRGAKLFGAVLTGSDYQVAHHNHQRELDTALAEGLKGFEMMHVTHVRTTPQKNQQLSYTRHVMQELEAISRDYEIDMAFTHWFGDHNTDHLAAWELSRVAFRRTPTVLQYQSNSYFDNVNIFQPQFFWGFSEQEYERKKAILSLHTTEWSYRVTRWDRELFDRERFWGYLCNHDYAEAFMVTRLCDSDRLGFRDRPADR